MMPPQRRPRTIPCDQCKKKHIRCDGEDPCAGCRKAGLECAPGNRSLRLKLYVAPNRKSETQKQRPSVDDTHEAFPTSTVAGAGSGSSPPPDPGYYSPPNSRGRQQATGDSSLHRVSSASDSSIRNSVGDAHVYHPHPESGHSAFLDGAPDGFGHSPGILSYSSASDRGDVIIPPPAPAPLPLWYYEDRPRPPKTPGQLTLQEACLVRCFATKLATTFDTTDRTGHFASYVPMRALNNSLLLNATCGVSSQYLLRMHNTSPSSVVEFEGTKLPDVTEESVIQYQSACISLLMEASSNREEYADGDILSAITLLRFHEQTDVLVTGSDSEVFQRAVQHIFETQFAQGRGLEALPKLFTPLSIYRPNHLSANIAAYLVALRMEIWAVLLYQRPMRLPIPSFKDCLRFDEDDGGDDYLWTRRVLVWCAHVLKLHYGSEGIKASDDDGYESRTELWGALKAFEFDWDTKRPSCFQPLYSQDRAPSEGRYFPGMWLANPCQVMALQHIEFGRIVLARHEASLQNMRLGGGDFASQATQALCLHSTRIACGLAACHPHRHELLTAAAVAISMCGQYVHDAGERAAMMDVLEMLRSDYVWNVSQAVDALRIGDESSPHAQ